MPHGCSEHGLSSTSSITCELTTLIQTPAVSSLGYWAASWLVFLLPLLTLIWSFLHTTPRVILSKQIRKVIHLLPTTTGWLTVVFRMESEALSTASLAFTSWPLLLRWSHPLLSPLEPTLWPHGLHVVYPTHKLTLDFKAQNSLPCLDLLLVLSSHRQVFAQR